MALSIAIACLKPSHQANMHGVTGMPAPSDVILLISNLSNGVFVKYPAIKSFTAILLLQATVAYAIEGINPAQDGYGFDWLHPETATCVKMTGKLMAKFKRCKFEKSVGFDGDTDAFTCTVNNKSEYIIFSNKPVCIDQLEIMKANGD